MSTVRFLWRLTREIENNVMQNLGGQTKCIFENEEVANGYHWGVTFHSTEKNLISCFRGKGNFLG